MRTVKNLPIGTPINSDSKFPDGTILNETENNSGTPVVEEIYGDILTNIYNLLRKAGLTANGVQDNDLNGYQMVEALQKLPNLLNDVEQQLNLQGKVFSANLDLSKLPDKYVFIARSVEDWTENTVYKFKGLGNTEYPFTATPFKSGDSVLVVIDSNGVRAYNLAPNAVNTDLFTPFGNPLAFNNSGKLWYQEQGKVFSDVPELIDLQNAVRVAQSDGTLLVYEVLLIGGFFYCLVFRPSTFVYRIFRFSVTDLATPILVSMVGKNFPSGTGTNDYQPHIYTNGSYLYITNGTGQNAADGVVDVFSIGNNITFTGSITLDVSFEKTTNAVLSNGFLFTLVNGVLRKYNLSTGSASYLASYPTGLGLLFCFKNNAYYSNDEVAKSWNLS